MHNSKVCFKVVRVVSLGVNIPLVGLGPLLWCSEIINLHFRFLKGVTFTSIFGSHLLCRSIFYWILFNLPYSEDFKVFFSLLLYFALCDRHRARSELRACMSGLKNMDHL